MGHVYDVGANGTEFDAIAPTSDGGFVAAGSATDANHDLGGLVVKVDGAGNVQWQRLLGPTGSNQVYLHDIQQTSDGGYVLAGQLHDGSATSTGAPLEPALVVRLDPSGNVSWLHAYDSVASGGGVTATVHAFSIVRRRTVVMPSAETGDADLADPERCAAASAHAERLDQSQTAYSGGLYCLDSETCTELTGVVNSPTRPPTAASSSQATQIWFKGANRDSFRGSRRSTATARSCGRSRTTRHSGAGGRSARTLPRPRSPP